MSETQSYESLTKLQFYEHLLTSVNIQLGAGKDVSDILSWVDGLIVDGQPFSLVNHEYQKELLTETHPRQCYIKGAQVGITTIIMLITMYGLITNRYKQGALYLFPSRGDVLDFSRGRFNPLISDNEDLAKYVQDTDSQTIKRIGRAMLYLRGARATAKIGGLKKSSSQLKSIPVDRIVFDERDEMDEAMIDLALERISHSEIKEEVHLGTPTIPDYGIDRLYQESDQRVWMIRCSKCGKETCLELDFPKCLEELTDGSVIRICVHCRDNIIHPRDGRWIAQYPSKSKDFVGRWISQLNSMYVDPAYILKLYRNPPRGNLSEVMNSKLGRAHIAAENRLTEQDVKDLCTDIPVAEYDDGPCYLGADVGSLIHCVIGRMHYAKKAQIVYIGKFPDWSQLDVLMKRFNVARAVVDALPETRLARAFAKNHPEKVFMCYYQEGRKGAYAWNEKERIVGVDRTESLDASHNEIAKGEICVPQESTALNEYAKHCSNVARVLKKDEETGSSKYIYIKTGEDHYRHATNYECIARNFGRESMFGDLDLD